MDYGHDIRFGAFLTPVATGQGEVVELSRFVEHLGYDVVSFQDHPYQAAFFDTWTLMSYVAGRTSRIRIVPNVLSAALRPPAIVGRAAASLDLLSGGRFELGIGSGAFGDAIAAMGGERRSVGATISALEESLAIIRGILDVDEPGPLHVAGRYHRVAGAARGPRPAHPVPILIGAYKPRMLALTGRVADGWMPSLPWLRSPGLREAGAMIDEAAAGAGRDPGAIRRVLNIMPQTGSSPGDWAEQLATLALGDGIGTFILASDDPRMLQLFIEDVAPAVRELVGDTRGAGAAGPGAATSATRSARRDGIAYDDVPAGLRAVEPGDRAYRDVRSTYLRGGSPGIVLQPADAEQVASAVAFARRHDGVELGIRSGGHGFSGRSTNDGGIVIDLQALDGIQVLDPDRRLVRIGAGARWTQVADALDPHGWAITSGDYGGVGVGGLATAGGIGWLARAHGLTIDHVVAAHLVLADGTAVRVDAEHDPELFWAVRGAGAAMGIATAFEVIADPVGELGFAQLAFDADDGFLERFGAAVEAAPRRLTANLMLTARGDRRIAQVFGAIDSGDADEVLETLRPLAGLGPLVGQQVTIQPYRDLLAAPVGPHHGRGTPVSRSVLVDHLSPEVAGHLDRVAMSGSLVAIRSAGGAVGDVPVEATAYAGRGANFSIAALGADDARLDPLWTPVEELASGSYFSFQSRVDARLLRLAFPAPTLDRLLEVKRRVDPGNVFRDNLDLALVDSLVAG